MHTDQKSTMRAKIEGSLLWRTIALFALLAALLVSLSTTTGAQSNPSSQLTITINSQGITPASATVSAGIVHLSIENKSNLETLKVRVTREGGALLREINVSSKDEERATELDLASGQYVISEASNTSWASRVTAQTPPSTIVPQPSPGTLP
jgi:hypothetical protein